MTSLASAPPLGAVVADIEPTYRKVFWRVVPFLMLCYVVAYLDRVNVGFAKLQMSQDLAFSETIYGLGAGVFFIGYFLFEVPSNLILEKVGARRWIARIMNAAVGFVSEDLVEGFAAGREKRTARFEGK